MSNWDISYSRLLDIPNINYCGKRISFLKVWKARRVTESQFCFVLLNPHQEKASNIAVLNTIYFVIYS